MARRRWRTVMMIFLLGTAVWLVYLGFEGARVRNIPAHLVGFLMLAFWIAGVCGVNIWAGEPLDPRKDPP